MNREAAESVLLRIHAITQTKGDAGEESGEKTEGCQAPECLEGEVYPQTRWALFKEGEFDNLSEPQLGHAINEMFARHGASFGRAEVAALFEGKPWYRPDPNVTFEQIEKEKFSDVERSNLLKLAELRNRKKGGR
jgi:hypothetical protein